MGLRGPCSGPFRTWPSAGTHRPGQRGQLLEQRGNRHQPPVDGVHGEPELLQGDDAEQRVRAGIAKDRDGGLRPIGDAYPDPGDVAGNFAAVGQDEGPLLIRPYAQPLELVPGHRGIRGARVHQGFEPGERAAAQMADVNGDVEAAHAN